MNTRNTYLSRQTAGVSVVAGSGSLAHAVLPHTR